jgi:hypothetical protein
MPTHIPEYDIMAKSNTEKPTAASPQAKANGGKPLNKMDAVRRALQDLGNDAKPVPLQGHIRQKYGIDMTTDHISTYKGIILKGSAKAKKSAPKPAASPAKASANGSRQDPGSAAPAAPKAAPTSLSQQVATLKAVAAAIGKDEAKKIIDLL